VPSVQGTPVANRLIGLLPRPQQIQFLAECQTIELHSGEILTEPGQRIHHAYFPGTCFISVIAPINIAAGLEVGMIGDEGMFGIGLVLGIDISPLRAIIQGAGSAWRMNGAVFDRAIKRSPALRRVLNRYLYVAFSQMAQTAACTRFHVVEARLARWLLMTQDRAHSEQLHVTQEFLAYMLGVRRVGVTKAATTLQQKNLIRYRRGDITIVDRSGLENAACQCYEADKKVYAQIIG